MIQTVVLLLLLVFCLIFLYQMTRGAAFVPSHKLTVEKIVNLAEIKPGMRVVDLGSGDGRILIAMARAGAAAVGYEINPILVFWSRKRIKKLGLDHQIEVKLGDFWKSDLSSFHVVVLFGIDYIMKQLEKKLKSELKPGSVVISNAFEFPNWAKLKSEYGLNIYKVE